MRKLTLLIALLFSLTLFADGKIVQQEDPDPLDTWRLVDLRFPLIGEDRAVVTVGYFRMSGALDRTEEHTFTGSDYATFLLAINTPSGVDEGTIQKPDGSIDLSAIFRLRISRWMILHDKIAGVTAEALNEVSIVAEEPTPPTPPEP